MQTTMAGGLNPSFKGKALRSGVPAYDNNSGIRTKGGYISEANANPVAFGSPLFVTTSAPNAFLSTPAAGAVFAGYLLNREFINEFSPAHASTLIQLQPADAVYHGAIWLALPDGVAPTVGAKLYADATTGAITLTGTSNIDLHSTVEEVELVDGVLYALVMVEA